MTTFLIGLILGSLVVVAGILYYQHRHIRIHTDENGNIKDEGHNPFSIHNINKMSVTFHSVIRDEIKAMLVLTLKVLIRLKKLSRKMLDRGISKIAHKIFPDEIYTGTIDENRILSHVEDQKKNGEKGQIHL
jgi:hypothetical protein